MAITIEFCTAVTGHITVTDEKELEHGANGLIRGRLQELGFIVANEINVLNVLREKTEREEIAEGKQTTHHNQV